MKSLEEAEDVAKRYIAKKLNVDAAAVYFDDSELTDVGIDRISVYKLSGHIHFTEKTTRPGFLGTKIGSRTTKREMIQRFSVQIEAMDGKVVGVKVDSLVPAAEETM